MVGQRVLVPSIGVRLPVPEPSECSERRLILRILRQRRSDQRCWEVAQRPEPKGLFYGQNNQNLFTKG